MELETMFTEQKWNILKCLSKEKFSPLQLAEKLNTTMANISQQLRLLEASNLVKKEKIKNRDKGKPRALFSLTDDYAYLISTMQRFAHKRLLRVTDHHKIILKIWFLKDPEVHYALERIYWKVEPYMKQIDIIAVNEKSKDLFLISDKAKEIEKLARNKSINVKVFSKEDAEKLIKQHKEPFSSINELTIIYDPNNMLKSNGGDS
jgi:DNA-binding transcriptional regulator GbsR (MarR family)